VQSYCGVRGDGWTVGDGGTYGVVVVVVVVAAAVVSLLTM
jgi:hypothetical protein